MMNPETLDIGVIQEKILIFGGPYSNFSALQALQKKAEEKGVFPNQCFCTGDIVGYCAESEQTVEQMKNWGAFSIQGNVEEQLVTDKQTCGCNFEKGSECDVMSAMWYPKAKNQLSTHSLRYLSTLPKYIRFSLPNGKKGIIVHGSFSHISEFVFRTTELERKKESFDAAGVDIIIAGHSGIPFVQNIEGKLWINPGVIGMPANNGELATCYGVFDPQTLEYSLETLEYDYQQTARQMRKNNSPECYVKTICETGLWPNEDIVPVGERR